MAITKMARNHLEPPLTVTQVSITNQNWELDMIADIHHSQYCGLNSQRLKWVGWRRLPYWVPPGSVGGFWVMLLPGREIHRWIKLQG